MTLIYEPKGKAREYSPLALNHYQGCDHGCRYCYVPKVMTNAKDYHHDQVKAREFSLIDLSWECRKGIYDQVLLSFTTDPYHHTDQAIGLTRKVLEILVQNQVPVAILTKGGKRCLRDMDLFKQAGTLIKVGASLTYFNEEESLKNEPGAALPKDRLETLAILHAEGITTWASMEPVMDPVQSLTLIRHSLLFVDHYKIGKLNHEETGINWSLWLAASVSVLRRTGKPFYVKKDLHVFAGKAGVTLAPEEIDQDQLTLKRERPVGPKVELPETLPLFGAS